jgi:hypothetical protein
MVRILFQLLIAVAAAPGGETIYILAAVLPLLHPHFPLGEVVGKEDAVSFHVAHQHSSYNIPVDQIQYLFLVTYHMCHFPHLAAISFLIKAIPSV